MSMAHLIPVVSSTDAACGIRPQQAGWVCQAAGIFDEREYKKRSLIEGIFGAEATKLHQLHCRFLIESNQRRFSKIRTIAWNLKVLNRFRCANKLGIPILE